LPPRSFTRDDNEPECEMAKGLARFTIEPGNDGYVLHIEDEDGETLQLEATAEQLDLIAEAVDDQLAMDTDENDIVDEDEEEG
jgi:hypothetical protein